VGIHPESNGDRSVFAPARLTGRGPEPLWGGGGDEVCPAKHHGDPIIKTNGYFWPILLHNGPIAHVSETYIDTTLH
jgi:hypothetical protein